MDKIRKLVIRSLQNILRKKRLNDIKAFGNNKLLNDYKVSDELHLREALGEKTLRRYLKAVGIVTRVPIEYDASMTVGDLIKVIR